MTENHSGNVGAKTWPGKDPEAKIPGKKKGILAAFLFQEAKIFGNVRFFEIGGTQGSLRAEVFPFKC